MRYEDSEGLISSPKDGKDSEMAGKLYHEAETRKCRISGCWAFEK